MAAGIFRVACRAGRSKRPGQHGTELVEQRQKDFLRYSGSRAYADGFRLLLRQLSVYDGIAVKVPGFVAGSTPLIDSDRDRMNHDTRRPGRVDPRGVSGEMGPSRYCSAECLFCLVMMCPQRWPPVTSVHGD